MSYKEIANEDHTAEATGAAWTPNGSWSTDYSTKCKATGKKILKNNLGWTPSGCTLASYTWISGSSSGIDATASKVKCENEKPHRKGDTGSCTGIFNLTANPFTPLTCSCSLEIKDAGQTKVLGK